MKIIRFLLPLIIAVPGFTSLLNSSYFSMHDDQHIARLYLLDQGIKQGQLYPRWVDMLGFGHGYPLFNFYPPLIYYVGEFFHLLGFSYFWSIKLVFITGFILSTFGIYYFSRRYLDRTPSFLAAVMGTYFSYHAVLIYVRGALAEFFSFAILPFVFLGMKKVSEKFSFRNILFLGLAFAVLILTHPLIAFPALIFIGFYFIHLLILHKDKLRLIKNFFWSFLLGLSLSAFFWLPSMIERKFTLVDSVFLAQASTHFYKIHYIYPQQFFYSPWGFGGSLQGPIDGLSFQLGRIHIGLFLLSIFFSFIYYFKNKKLDDVLRNFYFFILITLFSLFMTTEYSAFIWDNVQTLQYLQFPWRMLTFTGIFMAVSIGYLLYFVNRIFSLKKLQWVGVIVISLLTIGVYSKYFKPQTLLQITDNQRTGFKELAWRISYTSHEFSPKGIPIKETKYGTRVIDIKEEDVTEKMFNVRNAEVEIKENRFADKKFLIRAKQPTSFRLNTYNFPGWFATIDDRETAIKDNNKYKLITVDIPQGEHLAEFKFRNTGVRTLASIISLLAVGFIFYKLFTSLKR